MRVWPAAVARVHEEVRRHAGDRQPPGRAHHHRAVGLQLLRRAGAPRPLQSRSERAAPVLRAQQHDRRVVLHGRPALRPDASARSPARCRCSSPNVRVWEVTDRDGSYVGLFYGDYFARAGKRSGAWMTTLSQPRDLHRHGRCTPITSNNNNFVRGAAGEPVLISLDDAETLFHEFGHAIHYLVSTVNYPGLGNDAARLRRVSEPGARALGADAPDPRPVRAPLPDQPADAAGAGRARAQRARPSTRATRRWSISPPRSSTCRCTTAPRRSPTSTPSSARR